MRKAKWLVILLAVALALTPASSVLALSSQDVTVTATPLYLAITNSPGTWLINGITGSGKIDPSTTYYAKDAGSETTQPSVTVLDTECEFTVTCSAGATTCDLTVNWGDFSGGDDNMTNGETGTAGATSYGAHSWYEGMTYANKVQVDKSGSAKMYTVGLAATGTLKWGAEIATQTNDWTSAASSTSTMTITASAN